MSRGLQIIKEYRYNRPATLWRGGKLRSIRKFIARGTLNCLTPFNLSWSFVFLCRKAQAPAAGHEQALVWQGYPIA